MTSTQSAPSATVVPFVPAPTIDGPAVGQMVVIMAEGRDRTWSKRHAKFSGVYRIKSVGPSNLSMDALDGGLPLRTPNIGVRLATADEVATATAKVAAVGAALCVGQCALITTKTGKVIAVVIKAQPNGSYNLAKLGGEAGRFYRSVPRASLTACDPQGNPTD